MILRSLHIKRLKRLKDLKLDFTNPDGSPRLWTVIIGENGTGKTSILQAIAMASAGSRLVNVLAERVATQLRDRRSARPMRVMADFTFQKPPNGHQREYPYRKRLGNGIGLRAQLDVTDDESTVQCRAAYHEDGAPPAPHAGEDPLVRARSRNLRYWFVAGYGVARAIPDAGTQPRLDHPSVDRLRTLFDSSIGLTSTAFANYFPATKAKAFARTLKKVLLTVRQPHLTDIELRGRGGVGRAGALQESERFTQQIGNTSLKLPLIALSHGYQSTVAWIADLVGHILLEAGGAVDASEMQGLVLIDELDLYLHPVWQTVLVSALRSTFPQLQFVATTHSPLITASLAPHEIVALSFDDETGDVMRRQVSQRA